MLFQARGGDVIPGVSTENTTAEPFLKSQPLLQALPLARALLCVTRGGMSCREWCETRELWVTTGEMLCCLPCRCSVYHGGVSLAGGVWCLVVLKNSPQIVDVCDTTNVPGRVITHAPLWLVQVTCFVF